MVILIICVTHTLTEITLPLVPVIHSGFGHTTFQTYYKTITIPQSYTTQEITQCRRKYGKIRMLKEKEIIVLGILFLFMCQK